MHKIDNYLWPGLDGRLSGASRHRMAEPEPAYTVAVVPVLKLLDSGDGSSAAR